MVPTAVSSIIEATGKLTVGLIAALYAINKGYDAPIIAAYAVSGLTVGAAVGAGFLIVTKKLIKSGEDISSKTGVAVRNTPEIVSEIIKISLPITLSSSLISLSGVIDTFVMTRRLVDIGYTYEAAAGAYGSYTTMAVSFFNFPNSLIVPFSVSIIPVIATAYANKNTEIIRTTAESAFRMVSIIAMPSAFGIAAMSRPILNLVFNDSGAVSRTAPLLSVLAAAIVFVSMVSVTNSMLQAQNQENKTIISMACGAAVKLTGSYMLTGIPAIGRFGTPISTCLCYLAIMSLNFFFLAKSDGANVIPAIKNTFIKPFISSSVTGFSAILIYRLARIAVSDKIAAAGAILLAVVIYVLMIFGLKTLTREDVLGLPKGAKIYASLKKFNLIA
jgi:stage V sporulation protein B